MANRRLLISLAHPDDESFGMGGLIARYVDEGVDVYLICATNGDVGTVEPERLNGYKSIAELRLSELDCAAQKLGFKKVFKLGYKDSGMMVDETIHDSSCLWFNWQNCPEEVTRQVVEVIREIKPQVVITFNRYGGYGHPDHIAIQRATTEAFHLAGDPDYITSQQPYKPQKLYYNSFPTFILRLVLGMMRLRGKDVRRMGKNHDIDFQAVLDNVEPVHARVDVHAYYDRWDEASACHDSQGGGMGGWMPGWIRKWLAPSQGFTRVYPAPPIDQVDEHDLFAGIQIEEPAAENVR